LGLPSIPALLAYTILSSPHGLVQQGKKRRTRRKKNNSPSAAVQRASLPFTLDWALLPQAY